MVSYTSNYGFEKPDPSDIVDIDGHLAGPFTGIDDQYGVSYIDGPPQVVGRVGSSPNLVSYDNSYGYFYLDEFAVTGTYMLHIEFKISVTSGQSCTVFITGPTLSGEPALVNIGLSSIGASTISAVTTSSLFSFTIPSTTPGTEYIKIDVPINVDGSRTLNGKPVVGISFTSSNNSYSLSPITYFGRML